MNEDPIVAEVRHARDKLAARFNYDIHAIFADLMARERVEDATHPLVRNASEWVETDEKAMVLNDQPPQKP